MWINFDDIMNVRDLGGLPCAEGRAIRPGRLLRGAGLHRATDADLARLRDEYRLAHIVDFRDGSECARQPDRMVEGAIYHSLPALPGLPTKEHPTPERDPEPDFDSAFRKVYTQLAESDSAVSAYRAFFRILLERPAGAVYWHCTQGKDRTGAAALLLLTALGASRETAQADYFLSNTGLRPALERPDSPDGPRWSRATKEKLFYVFPAYLNIYYDCMERRWGGLEGYLSGALGLTEAELAALRREYLE